MYIIDRRIIEHTKDGLKTVHVQTDLWSVKAEEFPYPHENPLNEKWKALSSVQLTTFQYCGTGRERLIRSHSSARFCFELSGNSN